VDGYDLLVMEYVEGRTLRGLGPAPEPLLRDIARQCAAGLAAIHDAGIVHRDLKPENIVLTADGRVRIMDLGIAKVHDASVMLTRTGQFLGSLPYAAPEQCDGREVGPAADLYALGVVLHELATGQNPFRGETPAAILRAKLVRVPAPAATLSPAFRAVLATLLDLDPAKRFGSARALLEALR
jgi:serine/threonine-protein kinase